MQQTLSNSYHSDKLFELSMDLICIAGYDGYFKKINPAVAKLLGYSEEELYSKPINEFIHPEDREITSTKRALIHTNTHLLNFENRYITKAGSTVWLHWTSIPCPEEKMVYAIAKDISHSKHIEENRNTLIANLIKENDNFKHISYTISHDLRSPINNLITIFDFLDLQKITDEQTQEAVTMLKKSSSNLKVTVDDYLNYLNTKIPLPNTNTQLHLQTVLDTVLNSLNTVIGNAKAKIEVNFSEIESIHFNKIYLESIFLNLITNAIKYSKTDCKPIIKIESRISQDNHQLIISDNGLGFDLDKIQDKLFGFNNTFHSHQDSTGIGLYLIYNHMKNMGGKIDLESTLNHGSTFILSFKKSI
jgi:PAS domain S-box-containing protein